LDCPSLPDSGYLHFRNRLYRGALRDRIPISGTMELTSRCNLRCVHCYISGSREPEPGLGTEALMDVIDQIADEGCLWLLLTGGEPLLRPDFREVYGHVKSRGILPMLFTNGTLITDDTADFLASMPPYLVEISIYGSTEATSRRVTGVPGSLGMALAGLERLLDRGVRVGLKTMVMTLNSHEIGSMKTLAKDYGIQFRFDTAINSGLDGDHSPLRYRLTPEETVELDARDEERMQECRELAEDFAASEDGSGSIYQCGAGMNTFHVDAFGMLRVCMMSRDRTYSIPEGSFREGWRSFVPEVLSRQWASDPPCRTCRLRSLCGQCPAWGYLEHGDPEARVEYLCRTALLRAEALGLGDRHPYNKVK